MQQTPPPAKVPKQAIDDKGERERIDTSPFGVFAGGVIISNTVNLQTATCTVGR